MIRALLQIIAIATLIWFAGETIRGRIESERQARVVVLEEAAR